MAYLKYIISIVLVLLCITVAYSGDRRNIKTYNTGEVGSYGNPIVKHYTLLDPGECDDTGCVMSEHTTQGGLLYQWYDVDDNGTCDKTVVWKIIVDPTWGTYYSLYKERTCGGSV